MRSNYKFLDISNLGNDKKRNIFVAISYNGSKYHGWQVQKNAVTVQEVFQSALEKIINETVCIKGCSRTDTGVHANMYVLNFKTNSRINCENLIYALNHFLPNDISVTECKEVSKNFHARYSCKGKEYIYKIWNNRIRNPFLDGMVLHYWYKLDEKILDEAAKKFIGKHDFTSFATLDNRDTENMERTIYDFNVTRKNDMIEIKVSADGFLYNMVRIMVGTLLRVAQGKIKKEDILGIINAQDRSKAGPTAPPCGLYLNKVFYDETDFEK